MRETDEKRGDDLTGKEGGGGPQAARTALSRIHSYLIIQQSPSHSSLCPAPPRSVPSLFTKLLLRRQTPDVNLSGELLRGRPPIALSGRPGWPTLQAPG